MACMCGDTHCWSCGPAQGNTQCELCGAWADDGCLHVDEVTGELKPRFRTALEKKLEAEAVAEVREDICG